MTVLCRRPSEAADGRSGPLPSVSNQVCPREGSRLYSGCDTRGFRFAVCSPVYGSLMLFHDLPEPLLEMGGVAVGL